MATGDLILGEGVIFIDGTAVGLTRGGSQFVVEREYRIIEADGDYGPVKGRIRKIRSVAKLTINALELSISNIRKFFPATRTQDDTIVLGDTDVATADYHQVSFVGKTASGASVSIYVLNAINLENFDLGLVDKEEVVASITFTSTYLEASRDQEEWAIDFT